MASKQIVYSRKLYLFGLAMCTFLVAGTCPDMGNQNDNEEMQNQNDNEQMQNENENDNQQGNRYQYFLHHELQIN